MVGLKGLLYTTADLMVTVSENIGPLSYWLIVIVWFCVFALEGSGQEANPIVPLFTTCRETSMILPFLGGTPNGFKCQSCVLTDEIHSKGGNRQETQ